MTSTPRPIQSVTTAELYARWAKVYDKDGNILQSLDDHLLPDLLSHVFTLLPQSAPATITELGCGTGRNTIKLLSPSLIVKLREINALDLTPAMLDVARQRCRELEASASEEDGSGGGSRGGERPSAEFYEFDALHPENFPDIVERLGGRADVVLSTLVLEHLPLATFFSALRFLLRRGGYAVVTNMHAEMGRIGQAGFVDEESGEKVRGVSYVYEIAEVVEEGRRWGFETVGKVRERAVKVEDLDAGVVGVRGRKWVGVRCWFGMVVKLGGEVWS